MSRMKARSFDQTACRLSLLLPLAAPGPLVAGPPQGQPVQTLGTDAWQVYGAPFTHKLNDDVPGRGTVVIQEPAKAEKPWSSGAGVPIPYAIAAGERVTAVFWARAGQPTSLTIGLQGGAPAYARFASSTRTLDQKWRQLTVSGTAPTNFAAHSQSLSVPLGLAGTKVTLGPVAFLRGTADRAAAKRAFAGFRPSEVMTDVRIASEPGVTLAGTLHLPTDNARAPFPLAVVIQGHGRNGRSGFTSIVKQLTGQGVAVLEYDKRGVGQSTGTFKEDIERLTADAAGAVAAMRRRPDIDGRRIAIIGQSQGGVIAPAVAAADPTIAAVVMLAGSVGDGLPYLQRTIGNQMIAAGRPKDKVPAVVNAMTALIQARSEGMDASTIEARRAALVDRFVAAGFSPLEAQGGLAMIDVEEAWQADKLRSASDLKALRIPVLAVFGSKDPMVIAADEAPAAQEALADNPRGKVVVLDGLSHWFQEGVTTGGAEEVGKLGPNLGSPRLVKLVGDWLNDALADPAKR